MAVTLYDQFGGSSTPTLTTGSDNCDYVVVVGPTYQDVYIKDGATAYRFYSRTSGIGGLTAGHVIGVDAQCVSGVEQRRPWAFVF